MGWVPASNYLGTEHQHSEWAYALPSVREGVSQIRAQALGWESAPPREARGTGPLLRMNDLHVGVTGMESTDGNPFAGNERDI